MRKDDIIKNKALLIKGDVNGCVRPLGTSRSRHGHGRFALKCQSWRRETSVSRSCELNTSEERQ